MKLNDRTLQVMKNFSTINSGVVLQKGKIQKTMSPEQTILAEARLDDDLPEVFGIYDLNQFLGNVTTLGNPALTFTNERVVMSDGEMSLNYYSCSPSLIVSPPNKELVLPKIDVNFSITNATLTKILRLASMNNLPNLTVLGKNGEINLQAHEAKNDTSNFVSTKVGDYDGVDFSVSFKTENLRLIPDDYSVEIAIGGFSKWSNKAGNLTYYIAMEKK
jgi:hypothetical protein